MSEPTTTKIRWWSVVWWVCPLNAAVGAFFGLPWGGVGIACGAVGGVVAGVLWSVWMSRQLANTRPALVWKAVGMGVAVGLLATLILHAGLLASQAVWYWYPYNMDSIIDRLLAPGGDDYWSTVVHMAIPCGLVAGGVMGLICGAICHSARESGEDVPERCEK